MKKKRTPKNLRITLDDFMLANRKAAREEEIAAHGKSECVMLVQGLKEAGGGSDYVKQFAEVRDEVVW